MPLTNFLTSEYLRWILKVKIYEHIMLDVFSYYFYFKKKIYIYISAFYALYYEINDSIFKEKRKY